MTKHAIIIGSKSDIAMELESFLLSDGWTTSGWHRNIAFPKVIPRWNLVLIALGCVAPVGHWADVDSYEWEESINSNLMLPIKLLRLVWGGREPDASVCFMAGSNPQKIMNGYSAYNASKMALLKTCEQLDQESPDAKFFALAPGYVPTKIHRATLAAGWKNERIERGGGTSIELIYKCLKWCMEADKETVGGRNICVSDPLGPQLVNQLAVNPAMFKLRRVQ